MSKKAVCIGVVCIITCIATMVGAGDPNLVGWWKLDETSGTIAHDSSGRDYHGTLINGGVWTAGQLDGGLRLDGVNDHVSLPIGQLISTLREASFTIWVNWSGTGGAWQRIFDFGTGTANYIYLCPLTGTTSSLRIAITANNGIWDEFDSSKGAMPTGWHHIAVTVSGSSRQMIMYLDGEVVGSIGNITNIVSNLGVTTQNWLGRSQYPDPYFNGVLDDFRIYNRILTQDQVKQVMFPVAEGASRPFPPDQSTDVARDIVLSWRPGAFPGTHDVYFSTSRQDVDAATRLNPRGVLVSRGQDPNTFAPGLLSYGQRYYWRIDEVNAKDGFIHKGEIWTFLVEPYSYPVRPTKATSSGNWRVTTGPEKTIGGVGLSPNDEHSTATADMWVCNTRTGWIQYEFDKVYKLDQVWVWNSNQTTEEAIGWGAKDVEILYSEDGQSWNSLGMFEFAQAPGEATYVTDIKVSLGGIFARYVKLDVKAPWGTGATVRASISEVRFFYIPLQAFGPEPADGATNVAINATLSWRPGRQAAKHQVYVGLDRAAVQTATVPTATVIDRRLSLLAAGAQYDRTYYWRVDEVNDQASPSVVAGNIWSLTTSPYKVVDDFEGYDDRCKRIYYAWIDGQGHSGDLQNCGVPAATGNGSGSLVGNMNPPFAERTIVYGGSQSMPMDYKGLSEATRRFDPVQDWTIGGIRYLVLYFRGDSTNTPGQLYVKVNNVQVNYPGKADDIRLGVWKQWNIDLSGVGGLRSVSSLTIGVNSTGTGRLYVDDIRLYRDAPVVVVPVDPGVNGLSVAYSFEGNCQDVSGRGLHGTAMNGPVYVEGKVGQAISLDGTNDYVELPIGSLINASSSMTISTWVNWPASGGGWQRIFDIGTSTANYMFLTPSAAGGTTGVLRFAIRQTTSTGESQANYSRTLPTGWHHVAVVIDGASMSLGLYLNGQLVGSGSTLVLPKDLGVTNQNWLGRSQFAADAYYMGQIDEFRIYNRALSIGEIRYLAGDRP